MTYIRFGKIKKVLAFAGKCVILLISLIRRLKKGVDEKVHSFLFGRAESPDGYAQREEDSHLAKREVYEQKTEALLTPIMEAQHLELVDVEFVKEAGTWYLRAYIDKPGGVTIDDCELVSRALSDRLDEEDFIEETYILEVSSPGLGRPLKKDKDFARSVGESVEVRLFRAVNKQKEFTGILKSWDKDAVTLEFEDTPEMTFERPNIALIRLAFDF